MTRPALRRNDIIHCGIEGYHQLKQGKTEDLQNNFYHIMVQLYSSEEAEG